MLIGLSGKNNIWLGSICWLLTNQTVVELMKNLEGGEGALSSINYIEIEFIA